MKFYSQSGQDQFLLENFFKGKRGGTFVDVGAYDGEKFSNSAFLERSMGWTGLCIEPLPSAFEKLSSSRTARCIPVCVSDFEGEGDFIESDTYTDGKMLSGLKASYDARHADLVGSLATNSSVRKVPVRKLSALLAENDMFDIDYCSIDVEGAEFNILSELDLEKFRISVFTIENNYGDERIANLMAGKGYEMIARLDQNEVYRRHDVKLLPKTSVICAVWHGDPKRHELLRGHAENLARQTVPVEPIYVFDGGDAPPDGLAGQVLTAREDLTIYQAWNVALSRVHTPLVMNLNLDDRLAPDAIELMERALMRSKADLVGGDWKVCYSQADTDAVQPCFSAAQLPPIDVWPPAHGSTARLGSGEGNMTYGPATLWRIGAHLGIPRYPHQFSDGTPIRTIGDTAWWMMLQEHLHKKVLRMPIVIGNYHSHPEDQATFRPRPHDELQLLKDVGVSLV